MDDATDTVHPADPSRYTMQLAADSSVAMRLDCNRATGTWSAEPGPNPSSGGFAFGPIAATRASCPPPSLGERSGARRVRPVLPAEGWPAHLSLMTDAGIYTWVAETVLSDWNQPVESSTNHTLPRAPPFGNDSP